MKNQNRYIQIHRSKKRLAEDNTLPSMSIGLTERKTIVYEFTGTRHQQASLLLTLAARDVGFQHALRLAHHALLQMEVEKQHDAAFIDECQNIINGKR